MRDEVTLLHGCHEPCWDLDLSKVFEGYYAVQFATRGDVVLYAGTHRVVLESPVFWFCHAGEQLRYHPKAKTVDHRYFAVRGPVVERWQLAGLFPADPVPCPVERVKRFACAFDQVARLVGRQGPWDGARATHTIEGILLDIAELRGTEALRESWLSAVLQELDTQRSLSPNYEKLARKVGMAVSTLRRRFRATTGMPIHRYLLDRRMGLARVLLRDPARPLKAVASDLGYRDVFFFTRQFTEYHGIPPGKYRKSVGVPTGPG
jgi:AraC-like DNA-binding protein